MFCGQRMGEFDASVHPTNAPQICSITIEATSILYCLREKKSQGPNGTPAFVV